MIKDLLFSFKYCVCWLTTDHICFLKAFSPPASCLLLTVVSSSFSNMAALGRIATVRGKNPQTHKFGLCKKPAFDFPNVPTCHLCLHVTTRIRSQDRCPVTRPVDTKRVPAEASSASAWWPDVYSPSFMRYFQFPITLRRKIPASIRFNTSRQRNYYCLSR